MSRLAGRLSIAKGVLSRLTAGQRNAVWPANPRRILVAHCLLLGDTLMLTPLLKKLRRQYPLAEIALTMQQAFLPLYAGRPYGVQALAFEPHDAHSVDRIIGSGPYDLGIVPGDNRHSWLAFAARCSHVVAHAGDRPAWKSWPVDTQQPMSDQPATWGEMVAELVPGPAPSPFDAAEWPAPVGGAIDRLAAPYAVLHVGASNPLRSWFAPRWLELANRLERRGLTVVWSAGSREASLVAEADPAGRYRSFAGKTDLCQLFHLLKQAHLLVCPDSGVAHLSRITATPSVVLYGQGSDQVFGTGSFWRTAPQRAVIEENFACRDQQHLFKREIAWVRRCDRRPPACARARCMEPLSVERVLETAEAVLATRRS
jgi:ADP-heptose:LPS heptosyltransferase